MDSAGGRLLGILFAGALITGALDEICEEEGATNICVIQNTKFPD